MTTQPGIAQNHPMSNRLRAIGIALIRLADECDAAAREITGTAPTFGLAESIVQMMALNGPMRQRDIMACLGNRRSYAGVANAMYRLRKMGYITKAGPTTWMLDPDIRRQIVAGEDPAEIRELVRTLDASKQQKPAQETANDSKQPDQARMADD